MTLAAILEFRLLDVGDRVHAEAADALADPEICHVKQGFPDFGILPVEVRLFLQEGVEVVLTPFLGPGPGGAAGLS